METSCPLPYPPQPGKRKTKQGKCSEEDMLPLSCWTLFLHPLQPLFSYTRESTLRVRGTPLPAQAPCNTFSTPPSWPGLAPCWGCLCCHLSGHQPKLVGYPFSLHWASKLRASPRPLPVSATLRQDPEAPWVQLKLSRKRELKPGD